MPFKPKPQTFPAAIGTLIIGTGDAALAMGGENVFPLYAFDAPIKNPPRVGVMVSDAGLANCAPGIADYYAGCADVPAMAAKACEMPGAEFVCLAFDLADPNGEDRPVEACVALAEAVAAAVTKPLVIMGCKNAEKDAVLFEKVAAALTGQNVLFMSAKEENYKAVGAAVGLAWGQKLAAESAVDINLAKQLNLLLTQLGVKGENMAMDVGSAAAGYGFEYVASTMERVKSTALGQNDAALQMPIVTPVGAEAWSVKEALAEEADMPLWGPREERGVNMEIVTAAACLASGSNAVILQHPEAVRTISALIGALV